MNIAEARFDQPVRLGALVPEPVGAAMSVFRRSGSTASAVLASLATCQTSQQLVGAMEALHLSFHHQPDAPAALLDELEAKLARA